MNGMYGNPAMRRWARKSARGEMAVEVTPATYKGVTLKSALLILLTIGVAVITEVILWRTVYNVLAGEMTGDQLMTGIVIGLAILGVAAVVMAVGSIIMFFNVRAAAFVGPLYSVTQGLFLGVMAGMLNLVLPGVSLAALLGTGIVFSVCLILYKSLGVRISNRFALGLLIAVISFLLVELICAPIVYFISAATDNPLVLLGAQAGMALFCVIFGSITVFMDIQNIDYMVQAGADKKYEWILAYCLTTGLVYLYVQILDLLIRLLALFGASKSKN